MWGSDYVQERHIGKEAVLCLRKDSNCVFELVLFLLCSTSIDHQRMACFSAFRKFVFVGLGLDLLYCLLSGPYRYNISKPMQGRLFAKAYDRYKETGESIDQVLKEGAWKCSQRAAKQGMLGSDYISDSSCCYNWVWSSWYSDTFKTYLLILLLIAWPCLTSFALSAYRSQLVWSPHFWQKICTYPSIDSLTRFWVLSNLAALAALDQHVK